MIDNPILRGFNPDPCICRVGDDYYIATSTFEWFPGVQIHHSRDLVHWRLLTRPLDRLSQLDLRGVPCSGGVWAPALSHDGERFHLIYTNQRHWGHGWWDGINYLVTAEDIAGPWSEPVFLNNAGFDPSMYHAEDGRKWLLNMRFDGGRGPGRKWFNGIEMQEYDPARKQLVGPVHLLWHGSERGITEGPHLMHRDGWYWLICAEGGTGHGHCITIARSRELLGPYDADPAGSIIHAPRDEDPELFKCGHGNLVQAGDGSWWLSHLCGRPIPSWQEGDEVEGNRYCPLGRESAIQRVDWPEGAFPRLAHGDSTPHRRHDGPDLPAHPWPPEPTAHDFASCDQLPMEFQSLREPIIDDWCSLAERPGFLRIRGGQGLCGTFSQHLIARRIEHIAFTAECALEFDPEDFKQRAGLAVYYDRANHRFLHISRDLDGNRELVLEWVDSRRWNTDARVPLPADGVVALRVTSDQTARMHFDYSLDDGATWQRIGDTHNLCHISDEHPGTGQFTGAFVGMACSDHRWLRHPADFSRFAYRPAEEQPI